MHNYSEGSIYKGVRNIIYIIVHSGLIAPLIFEVVFERFGRKH